MTKSRPTPIANCGQLKKLRCLVCVLGLLTLVAVPWVRPVIADGDKPRISYSEMRTSGRPGEFYKLGFSADNQVCHDALQLLNRPAPIPPGLRAPHDYAKIDTAFFLRTNTNVAWEPRWLTSVIGSKAGRAGVLDEVAADIFNTDHVLDLRRFEGSVGGNRYHSIYAAPAEVLHEYLKESGDRVEGLRVTRLTVPLSKLEPYRLDFNLIFATEILRMKDYPWEGTFADVVEVDGKFYVLLTSAVEKYRQNRVYLLEFYSPKNRRLVCEYSSEYVFVDK